MTYDAKLDSIVESNWIFSEVCLYIYSLIFFFYTYPIYNLFIPYLGDVDVMFLELQIWYTKHTHVRTHTHTYI